jgi:hypothetical protein
MVKLHLTSFVRTGKYIWQERTIPTRLQVRCSSFSVWPKLRATPYDVYNIALECQTSGSEGVIALSKRSHRILLKKASFEEKIEISRGISQSVEDI